MINKRFSILALISILLLAGCSIPALVGVAPGVPLLSGKQPLLLFEVPANATPSPTPFQPLSPTQLSLDAHIPVAAPTRTSTPIAGTIAKKISDYPGPSIAPDIDLPEPMGILQQPKGQINILLLGSDMRPTDGSYRTDTITLLTIDPTLGTANLTSFPRDLYVYIPGWTVNRINTAQMHGEFPLTQMTFEYNFGVRPDHYVLINFSSFKEVVDSLGGIDVAVAETITDHRDRIGAFTVYAGVQHMDGELALWYVRARYTTDDFARTRRQQEVMMAVFNKLISLDAITKAASLYDIYRQNVVTDLTLSDITPLLPMAAQLTDTSRIHHYFITRNEVIPWQNTNGAQVLIPIRESVLAIMRQALNCPVQ